MHKAAPGGEPDPALMREKNQNHYDVLNRRKPAHFNSRRPRGDAQVTREHFTETVKLEGLDSLGLGRDEQRYLKYLANRQEPTQLSTLESTLGIHRRTIQAVVEPFLLRCGLIEKTDKGRLITLDGMRHLGLVAQTQEQMANGSES